MIRIERLAAHHRRDGFDCGEPALNEFLQRQAGQHQRRGFSKTYVALGADDKQVTGYISLSAGQIQTQRLPPGLKLPRYPAPVLRIGRLGVDLAAQGQGVGQHLLAFALQIALEFSEQIGLYAVLVDAKHERAAAFYQTLGFVASLDDPLCLYLPIGTLRQATPPARKP